MGGTYIFLALVVLINCFTAMPGKIGSKKNIPLKSFFEPAPAPFLKPEYELSWADTVWRCCGSSFYIHQESVGLKEDVLFYISSNNYHGQSSRITGISLYAVDLIQKKLKWEFGFSKDYKTKFESGSGLIFLVGNKSITTMAAMILALDEQTGKVVWQYEVNFEDEGKELQDIVYNEGSLYVVFHDFGKGGGQNTLKLVELDAKTGNKRKENELGKDFQSSMGFQAVYFLTEIQPETLERKLVLIKNNFFVVGRKENPLFPYPGRIQETGTGDAILAVDMKTGKPAWEFLGFYDNQITGLELAENKKIVHFKQSLNLKKNHNGLDLTTGKKVKVSPASFTKKFDYDRLPGGGYKGNIFEVISGNNVYKIRYKLSDIWVYRKRD